MINVWPRAELYQSMATARVDLRTQHIVLGDQLYRLIDSDGVGGRNLMLLYVLLLDACCAAGDSP